MVSRKTKNLLTSQQRILYPKLNSPAKIQDFLNSLEMNFQDKYWSPAKVLKLGKAQCLEGALFAASVLRFHGHKPLIMDLRAKRPDVDHIVALFTMRGYWGAISKTNHAVLRYREPIYKTLRELAVSYFHEYFDNKTGTKNLREYSIALNVSRFDSLEWETTEKPLPQVAEAVDSARHFLLLNKHQERVLRKADMLERKAGRLVEWGH